MPRPARKLWKFYIVPTDPADGPRRRGLGQRDGDRPADLVRPVLGSGRGRRRQRVGQLRLRSRAQPGLHRHRQRQPAHVALPQRGEGRQPVPVLDRRGRRDHRRVQAGTTRKCPRRTGTTPAPSRSCSPTSTIDGQVAQGRDARAQERVLLRDRPRHRRADQRQELYLGQHLGERDRHGHRPPDRAARPRTTRPRRT